MFSRIYNLEYVIINDNLVWFYLSQYFKITTNCNTCKISFRFQFKQNKVEMSNNCTIELWFWLLFVAAITLWAAVEAFFGSWSIAHRKFTCRWSWPCPPASWLNILQRRHIRRYVRFLVSRRNLCFRVTSTSITSSDYHSASL